MCVRPIVVALLVSTLCVPSTHAGLFLGRLSDSEIKRVLLAEIEAAIGHELRDISSKRLIEIETALRPTFDVLPKLDGRLEHDGVRYLLRRVFAQQHGWYVNGLQIGGEAWNSSSTNLLMRDHLPELVQELFESRVGGRGSRLQDVVALAATIEHLIRDELRGNLESVYRVKGYGLDSHVNRTEARVLMEVYMICFLRGQDASELDARKVDILERKFHRQYPAWNALKEVIAEVQRERAPMEAAFSFDAVTSLLEVVADRFAPFYESQCNELKNALVDIEEKRSGRVRLVDFYKAALEDGMYQFTETVETLRHYGVLDEADSANPRVIIPNYIGDQPNCVARTSFYSTCCPNTCEALLNRIETKLGKSEATPQEIVSAIEDPQAALETGFRGLTPWLRQRLEDLAMHHNGQIPFHGRLFAQWMHFVHPRDCIYPHLSGSTFQRPLEEFAAQSGRSTSLTMQELKDVNVRLSSALEAPDTVMAQADSDFHYITGMWTMEEELFVERCQVDAKPEEPRREFPKIFGIMMISIVAACGFLKSSVLGTKQSDKGTIAKYIV